MAKQNRSDTVSDARGKCVTEKRPVSLFFSLLQKLRQFKEEVGPLHLLPHDITHAVEDGKSIIGLEAMCSLSCLSSRSWQEFMTL